MEKIENRKLTPAERIARKQETEAKAKVETEAKAREVAEEAIATAYESNTITGEEANLLLAYIQTLTLAELVIMPDVAQMMISHQASITPKQVPVGSSRRSWILQEIRQNPGRYTVRALGDVADSLYVVKGNGQEYGQGGVSAVQAMLAQKCFIRDNAGKLIPHPPKVIEKAKE